MKKLLLILIILIISLYSCQEESQEAKISDISNNIEDIGGSANTCIHANTFYDSFHSYHDVLIEYVSIEKFEEWIKLDYVKTDECPYYGQNIYEFIKYFAIPKEDFSNMYYNTDMYYSCDYNVDLLYGGDEEAIYKYYENGGNYKEMRKRLLDQSVKIDLKHLIDTDGYSEWMNKKGYNYVVQWSIPEFVYDFNIAEATLDDIVNVYKKNAELYSSHTDNVSKNENIYNYNFEKLFSSRSEFERLISEGVPAYEIDKMIH
jgi:hypothetical protein